MNNLEKVSKGQIGVHQERTAKVFDEKYGIRRKGLRTVIEELKQKILVKAAEISRYEERVQEYMINRLFKMDQKKVYNKVNGQTESSN